MNCCFKIHITGIVQGVGFRPFIYNLAKRHHLFGYVLNNTSGVLIELEGEIKAIELFMDQVRNQPPPPGGYL